MIPEKYVRRITDHMLVDLYLSGVDGGRVIWPWKMQAVHEADQTHVITSERYVLDSGWQRPDLGTRDVLDRAYTLGADVAVLVDVYQDKDETVDRILKDIEIVDSHPYDGELMVPLQAPYGDCYRELEGTGSIYAIGGLKDGLDAERLEAAREVRAVAGPDVRLHGLGWGPSEQIAKAIHRDPDLLESIDYSTPLRKGIDMLPSESGAERSTITAAGAVVRLLRDAR